MYNGAEKRIGKGRFCREFAVKTNKIMDLNTVKTVVVKIGTSTLTYENGKMNLRRIDKLCRTLCDLQNGGRRIVLVTSGAIGVGMGKLGLPERPDDTAKKQALAAIGQCELMFAYDKFFGEYHQNVAQVLLTADVTSQPISRRNVENTFRELLDMNVIPIVNENDTVAVDELEGRNFGDNDTLSAIVASIINADVLMILTDIDGVYDKTRRSIPTQSVSASSRRSTTRCVPWRAGQAPHAVQAAWQRKFAPQRLQGVQISRHISSPAKIRRTSTAFSTARTSARCSCRNLQKGTQRV